LTYALGSMAPKNIDIHRTTKTFWYYI